MSITITYNGRTLTKWYIVGDQNRPLPEFKVQTHGVDGADGELFGAQTIGPRYVSFRLTSIHKTSKQLQDEARFLMGFFAVRSPKPLTISDEVDSNGTQLVRYAIPSGAFNAEEWIDSGSWVVQFVSPDPYLYGKQRSVILNANATNHINIGGNAAANWTAGAASVSGNTYKLTYGTRHVEFKAAFSGTHRIDIDSEKMTVITGASGDGITTSSVIAPMYGQLDVTATSRTTLNWTERWL